MINDIREKLMLDDDGDADEYEEALDEENIHVITSVTATLLWRALARHEKATEYIYIYIYIWYIKINSILFVKTSWKRLKDLRTLVAMSSQRPC